MKRILTIAAIAVVLVGCGTTAAEREAANIKAVTQSAGKEMTACKIAIYNKPEYDSIRDKLLSPENKFQPTLAQLADDSVPTKDESNLLIRYHDDILPCRGDALSKVESVAPEFTSAMAVGMAEQDEIQLQLVKRHISWGKADKELVQVGQQIRQEAKDGAAEIKNRLGASNQAELAQRQATTNTVLLASSVLLQWSVDLAAINAENRPVYTNCTESGPYTNCVSSR